MTTKRKRELGRIVGKAIGTLRECDDARAHDAVQALVGEDDRGVVELRRQDSAARQAGVPAHLEDVGEIAGEGEAQRRRHIVLAVIGQGEALVEAPAPEETRAFDVDHALRRRAPAQLRQRAIGHVGAEEDVILADAGAQQRRRGATDAQAEP